MRRKVRARKVSKMLKVLNMITFRVMSMLGEVRGER
jgi:hypothetical protein